MSQAIVFNPLTGKFDIVESFSGDAADLISSDANNALELGADGKLFVVEDEALNERASILAASASPVRFAVATDTHEVFFADGTQWRVAPLPLGDVSVTADIGAIPFKQDWGYGIADLANKTLHTIVVGDFNGAFVPLRRGAFRCNYAANTLQYYDGSQWLNLISLTSSQVRDWMLRSQWNTESVKSAPSFGTTAKTVMTLGFVDIGAIPSDLFIDGGSLT